MIDKKQLRIGNHVKCKGIDKIVQIYELDSLIVSVMESDKDAPTLLDYDDLAPIPLTAELLQELGFEHVGKTLYVKHFDVSHIALSVVGNGLWRVQEYDDVVCHGTMLCRYLHELENFIYLTIGKELVG